MSDVNGAFTLEQLDLFSTSIDDLAFSLDNAIWESSDTTVFYGGGSVSGSAATTAGSRAMASR